MLGLADYDTSILHNLSGLDEYIASVDMPNLSLLALNVSGERERKIKKNVSERRKKKLLNCQLTILPLNMQIPNEKSVTKQYTG